MFLSFKAARCRVGPLRTSHEFRLVEKQIQRVNITRRRPVAHLHLHPLRAQLAIDWEPILHGHQEKAKRGKKKDG